MTGSQSLVGPSVLRVVCPVPWPLVPLALSCLAALALPLLSGGLLSVLCPPALLVLPLCPLLRLLLLPLLLPVCLLRTGSFRLCLVALPLWSSVVGVGCIRRSVLILGSKVTALASPTPVAKLC